MSMSKHDGRGSPDDDLLRRGLPVNLDAERFVLASILYDESNWARAAAELTDDDFSLEKHRRVWLRMRELAESGVHIDRITVAEALQRHDQLDSVGGISGLVDLDDGLPGVFTIESYLTILKSKAKLRAIIRAAYRTIERAALGDDPEDIVRDISTAFLALPDTAARTGLRSVEDIVNSYEGGVNALLDPSKRPKGVMTGFTKFDQMTGGLRPGELVVVAARPSMGKTSLALDIARHVAMQRDDPRVVAIFTLEMSAESVLERMVCSDAMLDTGRFRAGYLDPFERRRAASSLSRLHHAQIKIDDTTSVSLFHVEAKLRRMQADTGLGLVIIDYLQLMTTPGRSENRNQEVGAISRGLKLLAKDLGVPVIVLSQLSRKPEERPGDHRPILSDLRESGNIEQDADIVTFVYREELYNRERSDLKGKAVWIVGKQRNGPVGDVNLVFIAEVTRFENPFHNG